MHKILTLATLSLFVIASCAQMGSVSTTSSPGNMSGTWKSETGNGMTLIIEVDGDVVTGYIDRGARGSENIMNVKVDGTTITFQTFSGFSQDYSCTFTNGTMTMKSPVLNGPVKFTRTE